MSSFLEQHPATSFLFTRSKSQVQLILKARVSPFEDSGKEFVDIFNPPSITIGKTIHEAAYEILGTEI